MIKYFDNLRQCIVLIGLRYTIFKLRHPCSI